MGINIFSQHNKPRKQENARKKKRKRKEGSGEEARAKREITKKNFDGTLCQRDSLYISEERVGGWA